MPLTLKWQPNDSPMTALLLTAQVAVLVAMIAVSWWGRDRIDPDRRIRARSGPTGIDFTMSRNTALLLTPIVGGLIVLAMLAIRDRPDPEPGAALGLVVMIIFFLAHWSSVRRAAR